MVSNNPLPSRIVRHCHSQIAVILRSALWTTCNYNCKSKLSNSSLIEVQVDYSRSTRLIAMSIGSFVIYLIIKLDATVVKLAVDISSFTIYLIVKLDATHSRFTYYCRIFC